MTEFGAMQMPGPEIVRSIYHQMISGHLSAFEPDVARMAGKITDATIDLHKTVMNNFLPSSVKFHYQFNLREMSNITQVRFSTCVMVLQLTGLAAFLSQCKSLCIVATLVGKSSTLNKRHLELCAKHAVRAGPAANDEGYLQGVHQGGQIVEARM